MPAGRGVTRLAAMHVIHHAHLRGPSSASEGDGERFCAAGPACGVHDFQVWIHTLPPGAHTPVQRHAGAFAALVMAGSGKLLVDGGPTRFQAPCTLVVPPHCDFQIANNATLPLRVVSVFTSEPASR